MTESMRLTPAGAGVPWWQRLGGKYLFLPLYSLRSWDGARDLLRREGEMLVDLAGGVAPEGLTRRVLVPRQVGLEDSSRHWSYCMVLEHLVIIGRRTAEIIIELSHGRTPPGPPVDTADLKPLGGRPSMETIAEFRGFLEAFHRETGEKVGDRRSTARFLHPWFGPLTARQWICFLPFHQRVHIRQARNILCSVRIRDHSIPPVNS